VRLSRRVATDHEVFLMFSHDDVINVTNALHDLLEDVAE
jgi:hypothetical protein